MSRAVRLNLAEGRASGFDMVLHYALGKLKLCNVELKELQRVVVEHIYNGNDVCSWLPTGYGKSLCYQHTPYRVDCKLEKCGEERLWICRHCRDRVSYSISDDRTSQRLRELGVLLDIGSRSRASSLLNTEAVSQSIARDIIGSRFYTTSVPHACIYYHDFLLIFAHMRIQRVPGPYLRARKKAWVRSYIKPSLGSQTFLQAPKLRTYVQTHSRRGKCKRGREERNV